MILRPRLSASILPHGVHRTDAVSDIVAIGPQAIEGEIFDDTGGREEVRPLGKCISSTVPSLIATLSRGAKDAVFVFRWDHHSVRSVALAAAAPNSQQRYARVKPRRL